MMEASSTSNQRSSAPLAESLLGGSAAGGGGGAGGNGRGDSSLAAVESEAERRTREKRTSWPTMQVITRLHRQSQEAIFGPKDPAMIRIQVAAAHVEDAVRGLANEKHARPQLALLSAKLGWLRGVTMLCYLSISFFEQPAWCYGSNCRPEDRDPVQQANLKFSGIPMVSRYASEGVELGCLLLFTLDMLLKYGYRGRTVFWRSKLNIASLGLLAVACIDVIVQLSWQNSVIGAYARLSASIRPVLFVTRDRRVRNVVVSLFRIAFAVADVFVLSLFLVLWFGALSVAVRAVGQPALPPPPPPPPPCCRLAS
eukprot:SAG22_NODE_432_length_10559_cov_29.404225_5_plen_312_part_00